MSEYRKMWGNYFDFLGRTCRRDYGWAVLVHLVIALVVLAACAFVWRGLSIALLAYGLGSLLPFLAINVRRLRDMGRSWTWMFILLIPIIGLVVYIIFIITPSVPDEGKAAA